MKNSKFQTSISSEMLMLNNQTRIPPGFALRHIRCCCWSFQLAAYLLLGCWGLALSSSAQYSVDWHKVAGGGGTSTNGQFSLSGTIGQHDARSAMTNGQFSVTGGFWVLPQVIQVEGAPTLVIAPAAPGYATISWTPNTPGFLLQETWSLSPANWTNSPSGSTNPVTLPVTGGAKFFRLGKL